MRPATARTMIGMPSPRPTFAPVERLLEEEEEEEDVGGWAVGSSKATLVPIALLVEV